jgi:L-aspartate oxidase
MKHLDPSHVRNRFPGIAKVCAGFRLDIAVDAIPVRPGAHYMIGGCIVDTEARTSLPGLWAAGEVTSTGLHGANRLASNSLLEGLVYGSIAGKNASNSALEDRREELRVLPVSSETQIMLKEPIDFADIRNSVRSLMWRNVGVRRQQERLEETIQTIQHYCSYVLSLQLESVDGWELQNMLTVSLQMATSALKRNESRGVHFRTDYPAQSLAWQKHLAMRRESV